MSGCITSHNESSLPINPKAYAIIAGLDRVNPSSYNGWKGTAFGCITDNSNSANMECYEIITLIKG